MIESDGITNTCHLRTTTSQCFSGQHKVSMVGSSSSRREEEEEEVHDRPAGCYYPDPARQAGNTEKRVQKSRTVKFLCQVAPRREVPYTRGPEPRAGCEKLRGCFCTTCRQSIPPSWRALQGCLAHCLERGLAQVLNMDCQSLAYLSFKNYRPGFVLDRDLGVPCSGDVEEARADMLMIETP